MKNVQRLRKADPAKVVAALNLLSTKELNATVAKRVKNALTAKPEEQLAAVKYACLFSNAAVVTEIANLF